MNLSPEAELHHTRGLLALRRAEAALPPAMTIREDTVPAGVDVALALMSLATVATSKALGKTEWMQRANGHLAEALSEFDQTLALAPGHAASHHYRARVLRHIGDTDAARVDARIAADLEPGNADYAALVRLLSPPAPGRPRTPERSVAAPRPPEPGRSRPAPTRDRATATPTSVPPDRRLTWDDIVLPERTKRALRQVELVLHAPEQARALGVEPPSGLLLWGPPGTGKTTIARILASRAGFRFFAASPADVFSMWIGEGEKAVAKLFDDARAAAPSIVFLDEIDALVPNRMGGMSQASDKIANQFLHEIDGLAGNQGVFTVGATNRPELLDSALVRGGRLSLKIEIPLPDTEARARILALHTRGVRLVPGVDLDELARETEGYSGADLRALVNQAGLQALIRIADEGGAEALSLADFVAAKDTILAGVDD
ncbi:MAG: AAA family ATPase [Armatimonadota bacterium]